METVSPPATPSNFMSPLSISPTSTHQSQAHRRTSSSASNHERSPTTPRRLSHRFSNVSNFSGDFSPLGEEKRSGAGNLAEELDQLDDDDEVFDEGATETTQDGQDMGQDKDADVIRDSGIDVSYTAKKSPPRARNFSKPFSPTQKPPDDDCEHESDLSADLEDAMNSIARMTSYTSTNEDPLISRAIGLLQDLGNQASLEAGAQRLTTSTNSLTTHLSSQTKALQTLSTSLLSPFAFGTLLDWNMVDEALPLIDDVLRDLPVPDREPLHGLQKLHLENVGVIETLSQLTDTLQMGKQATNTAARNLRTTQTIVTELRRERERADQARQHLSESTIHDALKERRCAQECRDVLSGFESFCETIRQGLDKDTGIATN